jgi:hypothetical protein
MFQRWQNAAIGSRIVTRLMDQVEYQQRRQQDSNYPQPDSSFERRNRSRSVFWLLLVVLLARFLGFLRRARRRLGARRGG